MKFDGLRGPWRMSGRAYNTARYGYVVLENAVPTRLTTALRQEIHAEVGARCGVTLGSGDARIRYVGKSQPCMVSVGGRTLWGETRQRGSSREHCERCGIAAADCAWCWRWY